MAHTRILALFASLLIPMAAQAQTTPYVRLTGGVLFATTGQTQTITFSPSYWKREIANRSEVTQTEGGISAGWRFPVTPSLAVEAGLGLYQTSTLTETGKVQQYSRPEFQNMTYAFDLQHQRVMLEGKLLTTYRSIYHPYFSAGLGLSNNRSNDYQETPTQTYAVADPAFSSHTETGMAYSAGLGVDVDIAQHWRVGAGYQYSYLGTAKLGPTPAAQIAQSFNAGSLQANELMIQITYAG